MPGTGRMKISRKLMQDVLRLPGFTTWITGASWDPNSLSIVLELTGNDIEDGELIDHLTIAEADPRELTPQ